MQAAAYEVEEMGQAEPSQEAPAQAMHMRQQGERCRLSLALSHFCRR